MPYCHECGKEYESNTKVCGNCGNPFRSLEEIISSDKLLDTDNQNNTIKLRRVVAGSIDWIIAVFVLFLTFASRVHFSFGKLWVKLLILILTCGYLVLKDCFDGKSIGKLFTGITVISKKTQKPIGFIESFNRNWFLGIPILGLTIFSLIGFVQILFGWSRWGEKSSNTEVVDDNKIENI